MIGKCKFDSSPTNKSQGYLNHRLNMSQKHAVVKKSYIAVGCIKKSVTHMRHGVTLLREILWVRPLLRV